MLDIEKIKPKSFQVLFLHDDPSQNVEVHEVGQIDYFAVQRHLEQGESVFITSKAAEKINPTDPVCQKMKTRLVTVLKFDNH